ncbi:fasciclin domain-containing protein [Pontibacter roseus]|uniref:fasciclin domain-containing protein n=1 Tax=Pontibacter roseus TaxID=336989 RepID=UPI00036A168C|nr:fasciclin domain-containing protein [Pontibacter roseus]
MKAKNIFFTGLALMGLSLMSCADHEESSQSEGSTEYIDEDKAARNMAPPSHVDQKNDAEPVGGGRVGDDTMTPSRNIVENATNNQNMVTFVSMLKSADMVGTLNGTGPYTLFAPNEAAFKALPGGRLEDLMKDENRQQLEQLLNNHLVAGKLAIADLQDGAMLKTVSGQQLKVSKKDGQVMVNGALIEEPDLMSSNGVLHGINKVLMPAQ